MDANSRSVAVPLISNGWNRTATHAVTTPDFEGRKRLARAMKVGDQAIPKLAGRFTPFNTRNKKSDGRGLRFHNEGFDYRNEWEIREIPRIGVSWERLRGGGRVPIGLCDESGRVCAQTHHCARPYLGQGDHPPDNAKMRWSDYHYRRTRW